MKLNTRGAIAAIFFTWAGLQAPVFAGSFEPAPGYIDHTANTGLSAGDGITSFDAVGSTLYNWQAPTSSFGQGGSLFIGDFQGNSVAVSPSDAGIGTYIDSAFNSFTRYNASDNSLWVGFTTTGNADDRIYSVDLNTNTWTHQATLAGNFDLEFSGANTFVSGLNTNASGDNSIWLLDTSGLNSHQEIVNTDGYSAGLAFDGSGNLYYGTNNDSFAQNVLYGFSSADVAASILSGTAIEIMTSDILSNVPSGVFDVAVNDEDLLFFNFNFAGPGFDESYLAMWDGVAGEAENFELLGEAFGDGYTYLTWLDAEGGTLGEDGAVYLLENSTNNLYVVAPEPSSGLLAGIALVGGILLRRARRS